LLKYTNTSSPIQASTLTLSVDLSSLFSPSIPVPPKPKIYEDPSLVDIDLGLEGLHSYDLTSLS